MAQIYKENILAVLAKLGITVPDYLSLNQKQIEDLIAAIKTTLDTYDPTPAATGNAVVAEVAIGKTFSNATKVGLVGTYVAPTVQSLTADADAIDLDIADTKTAYVNGVKVTGSYVAPTVQSLTADADALESDIAIGKTAYVNGVKLVGTLV